MQELKKKNNLKKNKKFIDILQLEAELLSERNTVIQNV